MNNNKIHTNYTPSAKKELEILIDDLKNQINAILAKEKYVTGDSEIEITASDIEQIKNRIKIKSPDKYQKYLLLGYLYTIVGVLFFLIAFFWNDIEDMLINDKINGIFGIVGAITACIGLLLTVFISTKSKKHIEDSIKIDIKQREFEIEELYKIILDIKAKEINKKKMSEDIKME